MSIVTPQDFTSILVVQVDETVPVQQVVVFSPAASGFSVSPPSFADVDAANGSLYYSTTASKLVYKDAGGVVNALY